MSSLTLEGCTQLVTNYIAHNHTTNLALGSGVLCALVAIESAGRVLQNLFQAATNAPAYQNPTFGDNVGKNLGGAVFFGLCASNTIPRTAALGAFIFFMNAMGKPDADALLTTRILHNVRPLASGAGNAAWKIIKAVAEAVGHVVKGIFDFVWNVMCAVGSVLNPIFKVIIPSSPVTFAATALAIAVIVYKGVLKY